jgi:hypothetical protein
MGLEIHRCMRLAQSVPTLLQDRTDSWAWSYNWLQTVTRDAVARDERKRNGAAVKVVLPGLFSEPF